MTRALCTPCVLFFLSSRLLDASDGLVEALAIGHVESGSIE